MPRPACGASNGDFEQAIPRAEASPVVGASRAPGTWERSAWVGGSLAANEGLVAPIEHGGDTAGVILGYLGLEFRKEGGRQHLSGRDTG